MRDSLFVKYIRIKNLSFLPIIRISILLFPFSSRSGVSENFGKKKIRYS